MRRRDFITLVGGAVAWPLAIRAQERMRHIGIITGISDEALTRERLAAFLPALQRLGWTEGRNVQIEYRWGKGNAETLRRDAMELAALAPDVIVATGGATMTYMLQATRTVPIVFVIVPDPVGSGFVKSLSRPGGNATGFMQFEYSLSGKWLELLKQIAPGVTRTAILWDPSVPAGIGQFAVIQSVAPALGVDVFPIKALDAGDIERDVAEFAQTANGGLIVTANPSTVVHRELIAALAVRHKLPAVYSTRDFVVSGGLASYAADFLDQYRRAAEYVDRILKGEKPANLPVQAPTKYVLTINLKSAKALGLEVPAMLLARGPLVVVADQGCLRHSRFMTHLRTRGDPFYCGARAKMKFRPCGRMLERIHRAYLRTDAYSDQAALDAPVATPRRLAPREEHADG